MRKKREFINRLVVILAGLGLFLSVGQLFSQEAEESEPEIKVRQLDTASPVGSESEEASPTKPGDRRKEIEARTKSNLILSGPAPLLEKP